MVVYDLICNKHHRFEGWFPNYEEFQNQSSRNLISCPTCGTTKVEKLPHACAVHVKKEEAPQQQRPQPVAAPPSGAPRLPMVPPRESTRAKIRQVLSELKTADALVGGRS